MFRLKTFSLKRKLMWIGALDSKAVANGEMINPPRDLPVQRGVAVEISIQKIMLSVEQAVIMQ